MVCTLGCKGATVRMLIHRQLGPRSGSPSSKMFFERLFINSGRQRPGEI